MTHTKNPQQKRRNIIEAAKSILRQGGIFTKFSLEKVARQAGVSKGGLMHHFPSKDALLCGVSESIIDEFETVLKQNLDEQDSSAGHFTRAYIKAALDSEHDTQAISPVLLAFYQAIDKSDADTRFNYWQKQTITDGLSIERATIIRLAVDGLLYQEIIDGQPIDAELREKVIAELYKLVEEATANS
ncbi:MAG: TetR/AcrR family transcriptional regulator [Chloroflexota bacterium]